MCGTPGAFGTFLYGVRTTDPALMAAALLSLSFIVVVTCTGLVPAWRAAQIDPLEGLRQD